MGGLILLLRPICFGLNNRSRDIVGNVGMVKNPSCAKCGACSVVCPVFRDSGRESHTARGKLHLLDVLGLERASAEFIDIFSACLLCGACTAICPRSIDIVDRLVTARNSFSSLSGPHGYEKYLARKLLEYPGSLAGLRALAQYLPADSGLRLRLGIVEKNSVLPFLKERQHPSLPKEFTKTVSWFPGCSARYLYPDIMTTCRSLFAVDGMQLNIPESLSCCGLADWAAGDLRGAQKKARRNIEIFEKLEGDILVSCASCYSHLKQYPVLFETDKSWQQRAQLVASRCVELSHGLAKRSRTQPGVQEKTDPKYRVFYHEPCHFRHDAEFEDKTIQQLQAIREIELVTLENGSRCCGQGGLFHLAHPEISTHIRDQLVKDVLRLQPDVVTTSCSGCLMQWQQGINASGGRVKVLHVAQLLDLF